MKTGKFNYFVGIDLTLSRAEHSHLLELAEVLPARVRFLHSWGNRFVAADLANPDRVPSDHDTLVVKVTEDEVAVLCELCEYDRWSRKPKPELTAGLKEVLHTLRAERERVNSLPSLGDKQC